MKIERVLELAGSRNPHMRKWAVGRLAFLGGDDAVSKLITAVGDPDEEVALKACIGLRDYCPKEAVDSLIEVLDRGDPLLVSNAALTLGMIGDPRGVEPLMELLKDPDAAIRGSAASALGGFKEDRVEDALMELLDIEGDWYVTISAVESLGRLRCFDALEPMVEKMLAAPDTTTHHRILTALADFADFRDIYTGMKSRDDAWELLDSILSEGVKAHPLGMEKEMEVLRDFLRANQDRDSLYGTALMLVGNELEWEGDDGPGFFRRLKDYDTIVCGCMMLLKRFARADIGGGPRDRVEARDTLAMCTFLRIILGGAETSPEEEAGLMGGLMRAGKTRPLELIRSLIEKGSEVEGDLIDVLGMDIGYPSHYAAEVLGRMGSIKAIPHLIAALDSDDWTLAERASDALGRIGEPAQEALVEFIMGGDEEGRMYACSSLAKIGGGRALEVLLDLLEDPRGISKAGTVADLAEMGDPAAIETLRQLMSSDPSYDVRIEARHAVLDLCRMHGVEVPELEAENEKADIFDPLARAMHPVTIHGDKKVGRNDPCPCGSGKKYKKCCGKAGTKGKVKKGEGPLSLVFRCGECGWEYEAVAGTAFTTGKPGDHDFYFSEEIRCPECKSNSYELTPWALSSLIAELTIIASEAESRKARGQGPASGTPRVQFIRGEVDGGPMSPQEGVAHYERKIERDPENPENHLRLGNCLRFVNEYDRAVQAYERSLDIDPDYAEPLHALGRIYLDRGEFRKARGYLEKARSSLESGAHNLAKNLSWEDVYTAVLIDLERCLDGIMEGEEEKRQLKAERDGLGHCLECGKPTRSHLTDSGEYMCHRCWEKGGCA